MKLDVHTKSFSMILRNYHLMKITRADDYKDLLSSLDENCS